MRTYPEDGDAGKTLLCQLQRQQHFGFPGAKGVVRPGTGGISARAGQPTDLALFLHPEEAGSCNSDQINAVRALPLQNKLIPWFPWWIVRVNPQELPVVQANIVLLFQRRKPGRGASSEIHVLPFGL